MSPFYLADGRPVIPMHLFIFNLPMHVLRALFDGRIFAYDWWDLHWSMFCAARWTRLA